MLDLSRESLANLEEGATRVIGAEAAGLVALWTQLHDFGNAVSSTLAWTAWSMLIALLLIAPFLMPRRPAGFSAAMIAADVLDER